MQYNQDKKYLVGLSFFEGIGPLRYQVLKKYFGSAEKIYTVPRKELLQTGLSENFVSRFDKFRREFNLDDFYKKQISARNVQIVSEDDQIYPKLLKEIKGAPFILYALGSIELFSENLKIAVVGTRKPTSYGKEITKKLVAELVEGGFTIVSGMAMGIDGIAHQTALSNKGKTIAVLGCGVDICYPAVNRFIYEDLKKKGLIISEFPPGFRTSRGVFPARNRIVVGLCQGVLITEGAQRSGSLISARYAGEFGRDVFAVPGPITSPMSEATNFLLKQGVKPVVDVNDIFEEYKLTLNQNKQKKTLEKFNNLTKEESLIIDIIRNNITVGIDEIVRISNMSSASVSSHVTILTLKGLLTQSETGEYSIIIS